MSSLFGIFRDQVLIRFIYPYLSPTSTVAHCLTISHHCHCLGTSGNIVFFLRSTKDHRMFKKKLTLSSSTTWTAEQLSLKGCRAPMFAHETTATISGIGHGCGHVLILCKFKNVRDAFHSWKESLMAPSMSYIRFKVILRNKLKPSNGSQDLGNASLSVAHLVPAKCQCPFPKMLLHCKLFQIAGIFCPHINLFPHC